MILKDQEIESKDESPSSPSEEEVLECEEEIPPCEGNLLMVKRLLENHPIELEKSQWGNLLYSHCKVYEIFVPCC